MADTDKVRTIRPWLAALLTFLGWGVGLYYVGRSKDAWRFAYGSVVFGLSLALALVGFIFLGPASTITLGQKDGFGPIDALQLSSSAVVAILVWRLAAKTPTAPQAGGARLLGYLAVWAVPLALSLAIAGAIRFTAVHPFQAPSRSMQPAISVGQYFLVTKWSYGYSRYSFAPFEALLPPGRIFSRRPQRGDIVVFRPLSAPDRDFAKRVVGLPGDRVQMIDGVLQLNGRAVERQALSAVLISEGGQATAIDAYRETLPGGASYVVLDRDNRGELDNTRVFVVPPDHYFMLGDDRDMSDDSRRSLGYVPFDNLIGKVTVIQARPHQTR